MRAIFDSIRKVATTDAPVLILGESGTGKEMAAKAIHQRSNRKDCQWDCHGWRRIVGMMTRFFGEFLGTPERHEIGSERVKRRQPGDENGDGEQQIIFLFEALREN